MYTIKPTTKFQKDLKRIQKLAAGEVLPPKNKDHYLTGIYEGYRECHIAPDWLLIYEIANDSLFLYLTRTGTHSDLFR